MTASSQGLEQWVWKSDRHKIQVICNKRFLQKSVFPDSHFLTTTTGLNFGQSPVSSKH